MSYKIIDRFVFGIFIASLVWLSWFTSQWLTTTRNGRIVVGIHMNSVILENA